MYIKSISLISLVFSLISFTSCNKTPTQTLKYNLEHDGLPISQDYIIACAAGMPEGFMGAEDYPVSTFFYPVTNAVNFKYYETLRDNIDPFNYSLYLPLDIADEYVFNGYLRRFPIVANKTNRWAIVTYEVNGEVRICDPVHIKVATQPTLWAPNSISIIDNGTTPNFDWEENINHNNKIHFQVVSDTNDNLISGTYTYDSQWQFYDLSNVVLNITDSSSNPILMSNIDYQFTLMSVTQDNWVNIFGQKEFTTQ
jgi:hypothetical protein